MSDTTTPATTEQPNAGAVAVTAGGDSSTGAPAASQTQQPNVGASQTTGAQGSQQQPAAQQSDQNQGPFATFPDADSFNRRMEREATKRLNEQAKGLGFDSWDAMQSQVSAARQAFNPQQGSSQPDNTGAQAQPSNEAARLQMALQVGKEKNLPIAIAERLQGDSVEAMQADADALLAMMQPSTPTGPSVPPVNTNQGQQPAFTSAQMDDPEFVRKNAAAIMQAARGGFVT